MKAQTGIIKRVFGSGGLTSKPNTNSSGPTVDFSNNLSGAKVKAKHDNDLANIEALSVDNSSSESGGLSVTGRDRI